ncbi:MAG: hypothetical protein KKA19_08875, partial [Candidatus Margulisbacteria bacterium]|nr:hypothetical protein [Candidatus Margulisiibacteriota bacterium]
GLIRYGNNQTSAAQNLNRNLWLKQKVGESYALACQELANNIYIKVIASSDKQPIENIILDLNQENANLDTYPKVIEYLNQIRDLQTNPEIKNMLNNFIQDSSSFQNYIEITAYIDDLYLDSNFSLDLNKEIRNKTDFLTWEEFKSNFNSFLIADDLNGILIQIATVPSSSLSTWAEIQSSINSNISNGPQVVQDKLSAELEQYVQNISEFNSWPELTAFINSLDLETELVEVLDTQTQQETDFNSWEELHTDLMRLKQAVQALVNLSQAVQLHTNNEYMLWEELHDFLKTISVKLALEKELNELLEKFTGYATWAELENHLISLNLTKEWQEAFLDVQYGLEKEGHYLIVNIKPRADWSQLNRTQFKLYWQDWTKISLDMEELVQDINGRTEDYCLEVKLKDGGKFKKHVNKVTSKAQLIAQLHNPIFRMIPLFASIGIMPANTEAKALIIEGCNLVGPGLVKEIIDLAADVTFKQQMEDGSVVSLLPYNPMTEILATAELPPMYDPIEYRNIVARGSVAFDKKETDAINVLFYGHNYAMDEALQQVSPFFSNGFMSGMVKNAYMYRIKSSPKWKKLPTSEGKIIALLGSFAQVALTKEGDIAVDIDSMRGKGVRHLRNVRNYEHMFKNKELDDFIQNVFFDDIDTINTAVTILKCFTTIPPIVEGGIRWAPGIKLAYLTYKAFENAEEVIDAAVSHMAILKNKYTEPYLRDALFDNPLLMLSGVYIVSGDEKERLPINQYQAQTDAGQYISSVPIQEPNGVYYQPLAFNVSKPFITVEGILKDLAPHKCTVEYSYNFAPFQALGNITSDGKYKVENLRVAEGQNILTFRITNMLGLQRQQFIRIIRSSSPLLPSNLYPTQGEMVGTKDINVKVDFYNAQFVSNNIEVTDLILFKIDGIEKPLEDVRITRGYINAYCNRLQAEYLTELTEGEHAVEIVAEDSYGHKIYARWSFYVDLTAPVIAIDPIDIYSPNNNEEPITFFYNLSDNISQKLKNIQINILDVEENIVKNLINLDEQTCGPQLINWDGKVAGEYVDDGEYSFIIFAKDQAGNLVEASTNIVIDTTAPIIEEFTFNTKVISTEEKILECSIKIKDNAQASSNVLRLKDLDRNVNYSFTVEYVPGAGENEYIGSCKLESNDFGFIIPDGRYEAWLVAEDQAGNQSLSSTESIIVDTTPPIIYNNYANPLVLSAENPVPYATTYYYQIKDETTITTNEKPSRNLWAKAKVIDKSTGQLIKEFLDLDTSEEINNFLWQPELASIHNGVYQIKLEVKDIHGNIAIALSEVIKDGVFPIIMTPQESSKLNGTVAIYGTVADADWTNIKEFESYAVYYAYGQQTLPSDLQHLDAKWQIIGLEVPILNRKYGQVEQNISYRAVQEGIITYWNTELITDATYTFLIIAKEKDLGATSGVIRTYEVDNTTTKTKIVPYAFAEGNPAEINFNSNPEIHLGFVNTNKTAHINVAILNAQGQIVKHHYYPNIEGAIYYGCPNYSSSAEKGAYLWEDKFGWHIRFNGDSAASYNASGYLVGVKSVQATTAVQLLPNDFNGNIVNFNGVVNQGEEYGFDFQLEDNVDALYISIDLEEGSLADNAKKIYLGINKNNPSVSQYAINIKGDNNAAYFDFIWDGKKDNNAFVDNGIYSIRVAAAGADGYGYKVSQSTINVQTPYTFQAGELTPADGNFGVFSVIDRVNFKYAVDKDSYINAFVYDQNTNELISELTNRKKVFGAKEEYTLSWNGAYPKAESTQRKVDGAYKIIIEALPYDGSATTQSYTYNNINIQGSSGTAQAILEPVGEEIAVNGNTVRASAGSTDYYWAARAEGKYYKPTPITYQVDASGEQLVSVNPFVPFAMLFHRGFKEVRVNLSASFVSRVHYTWYDGGTKRYSSHGSKYPSHSIAAVFTKDRLNYASTGPRTYGNCRHSGHRSPSSERHSPIYITLTDAYGNVLDSIDYNGSRYRGFLLNGAIKVDVEASLPGQDSEVIIREFRLVDNVEYSRLSNRYYAWYGWINADTTRTMDFGSMVKDHCKLGFPGITFFKDVNYYRSDFVVLKNAFRFGSGNNYSLGNQIIRIDDLINGPITITGPWSSQSDSSNTPYAASLLINSADGNVISNHLFDYPGITDQIDPSTNMISCTVSFERNEIVAMIGGIVIHRFYVWRPIITIKSVNNSALEALKGIKIDIDVNEEFAFTPDSINSQAQSDRIDSLKNFLASYADYGIFIKD